MPFQNPVSPIRYEPDDSCPPSALISTALQGILLVLAPTILVVAITVKSSDQGDAFLTWSAFATLIIVGLMVALQASRIGRVGGGHLIICGVTPNYIAVSIIALAEGGPGLLASLIVASALFYYSIAAWMPYLRRIITPAVSGVVSMLIAAMILPTAINLSNDVPSNSPSFAGTSAAILTAFLSVLLVLRAPRTWRPWALTLGIVGGGLFSASLGLYDLEPVLSASWFGFPELGFPGLDLTPGTEFWVLLPMFLIVTLTQGIKNISDSIGIQRASSKRSKVTDFRLVQGSIYANGTGILLAGVAGTPPTSTYPSLTVPLVNVTGVATRSVGYVMAAILIFLAFFPKVSGILLTIPHPVLGGFLLFAVGLLFIEGIQNLVRSGLDVEKSLVAGISLSIGLGMEIHNLFAEFLPDPWGLLLGNGITIGALSAMGLTWLLNISRPRARRLTTSLETSEIPKVDAFLQEVAAKAGWNSSSIERLRSVGEEAFVVLLDSVEIEESGKAPQLRMTARPEDGSIELELVTVFDESNLQDHLAYLEDQSETIDERDISLRLLRHYASSVRHQKYQGVDVIGITVEGF